MEINILSIFLNPMNEKMFFFLDRFIIILFNRTYKVIKLNIR